MAALFDSMGGAERLVLAPHALGQAAQLAAA